MNYYKFHKMTLHFKIHIYMCNYTFSIELIPLCLQTSEILAFFVHCQLLRKQYLRFDRQFQNGHVTSYNLFSHLQLFYLRQVVLTETGTTFTVPHLHL